MSVSCSDCFSDLLCEEDSAGVLSDSSPACSPWDLGSQERAEESVAGFIEDEEESVAGFIEDEEHFVPGPDYVARFRPQSLDASAREESVAWILKVHAFYGFQPLTAYLSVNYLDRFLCSRILPQPNGWPMQLLSVACLSLAAKMEEPLVPSLLDLQVGGARYIFEPRTIRRMEFLVLSVLDWRLRSITPFAFIGFFAWKVDPTGTGVGFLVSRATQVILSNVQETSLLEYRPSCIAVAAVLHAASDIPSLSLCNPENAESWCDGLSKEKIISCYRLMQKMVHSGSKRKAPKVLPQFRLTTQARTRFSDSSSSSSLSPSYDNNRRKLSNILWVDVDKGNSEPGEIE
ncbi:cyclin-D1-1 [Rhodamnia argentea]|uniref:Cyclin-D1-1 n=1 Tax=Rhodamnia argentea TaxID=178133 RepID=A0A8B8QXY8_9MYRT|nr:cyclin-D1-1 [Rhodamnia argentea]